MSSAFSNTEFINQIRIATEPDIPVLVKLINSAYRGEESKAGWTTEADVVAGDIRTDEENLNELMKKPGAVFLTYTNDKNEIEGTVFLHNREPGKLYLGMLSVNPELQTKGTGKKMMAAAEVHARNLNCQCIYMRVISIRHELIAWYERQGYYQTGETQPFPSDKFGMAKQPLEFIVLQKDI